MAQKTLDITNFDVEHESLQDLIQNVKDSWDYKDKTFKSHVSSFKSQVETGRKLPQKPLFIDPGTNATSSEVLEYLKHLQDVELSLFKIGWRLITCASTMKITELVASVDTSTILQRSLSSSALPNAANERQTFSVKSIENANASTSRTALYKTKPKYGGGLFNILRCFFGLCPVSLTHTPITQMVARPLPKKPMIHEIMQNIKYDYNLSLLSSEPDALNILSNLREIWIPFNPTKLTVNVNPPPVNSVSLKEVLHVMKSILKSSAFKYKSFDCKETEPCILCECKYTLNGNTYILSMRVILTDNAKAKFVVYKHIEGNEPSPFDTLDYQLLEESFSKDELEQAQIVLLDIRPIYTGTSKLIGNLDALKKQLADQDKIPEIQPAAEITPVVSDAGTSDVVNLKTLQDFIEYALVKCIDYRTPKS